MDCLVIPIQNKLEEWKKTTQVMDKEHAKGMKIRLRRAAFLAMPSFYIFFAEYKKYRSHIKKKSEQVSRLRKKSKKEIRTSSAQAVVNMPMADPSLQRLIEQTSKDLNNQYRQLFDHEKKCLRKIIAEERHRYCNLVASLKPIIDEELGMLGELASVEDIMQKLGSVTANPDEIITDQLIQDASSGQQPMVYATPPATPSPSMGSRKSSMCSIASLASSTSLMSPQQPLSPSRSSTTSSLRRQTSYRMSYNEPPDSRPSSALSSLVSFWLMACFIGANYIEM